MFALPSVTATLPFSLAADVLVQVQGSALCPSRADVVRQLERLIPATPQHVEPDRASLEPEPGAVRITLTRADGTMVGQKRLQLNASCAEVAEAVAVVIAIWERPLRPGLVPPLDPSLSSGGPDATGGNMVEDSRQAVLGETSAPVVPENMAPLDRGETDAASSRAAWRFEGGLALQSLFPQLVPGALIEGAARKTSAGWGIRFALGGAWWTEAELGSGHISWTRITGGLGLIHGWAGPRFFLDLREQFLGAALVATGHGYDQTRTRTVFDPGVDVGIRSGIVLGPLLRAWVDVGLTWWPVTEQLRVDGFDERVNAAHWVGSLAVGGTFLSTR
jgi:hypothetical protein